MKRRTSLFIVLVARLCQPECAHIQRTDVHRSNLDTSQLAYPTPMAAFGARPSERLRGGPCRHEFAVGLSPGRFVLLTVQAQVFAYVPMYAVELVGDDAAQVAVERWLGHGFEERPDVDCSFAHV